MRNKINYNNSVKEVLTKLSECNPGAYNVLYDMAVAGNYLEIWSLDDMNIRGNQIWVGYKDYCKENFDNFINCINKRDDELIESINIETAKSCKKGNGPNNKAIKRGATLMDADDERLMLTDSEIAKLSKKEKPVYNPTEKI